MAQYETLRQDIYDLQSETTMLSGQILVKVQILEELLNEARQSLVSDKQKNVGKEDEIDNVDSQILLIDSIEDDITDYKDILDIVGTRIQYLDLPKHL